MLIQGFRKSEFQSVKHWYISHIVIKIKWARSTVSTLSHYRNTLDMRSFTNLLIPSSVLNSLFNSLLMHIRI